MPPPPSVATRRRLQLERLPLEPCAAAAELADEAQPATPELTEAESRLQAASPQVGAAGWRNWLATTETQASCAVQRHLKRFEQRAAEARLQQAQQELAQLPASERGTSTLLNEVSEALPGLEL